MLRALTRCFAATVLLMIAGLAAYTYHTFDSERAHLREALEREQQRATELDQIIHRLGDERRVAQVLVTGQRTAADGVLETSVLFVEDARDGSARTLPPRSFNLRGGMVHVAAQVIRFERRFVQQGDPLHGRSIALFTGIYGDQQKPADAEQIDAPGAIPAVYQANLDSANPRAREFELALWKQFWRLFSDDEFRKRNGVEASFGQDVWGPFQPGRLYTITLEPAGSLSLKSEPLAGIYLELLKQKQAEVTSAR
jgi:hypothetical protein